MIDHKSPIDCTLVKQQVVLLKPQDLIVQAIATCEALSDCAQSPVPRQRLWIGPTVPTVEENWAWLGHVETFENVFSGGKQFL